MVNNFLLKEADKQAGIVDLCTGKLPGGMEFYVYLLLKPSTYQEYVNKVNNNEPVKFTDYGKIIYADEGTEPPKHIKEEMEAKYTVNHNFKQMVEEEAKRIATNPTDEDKHKYSSYG